MSVNVEPTRLTATTALKAAGKPSGAQATPSKPSFEQIANSVAHAATDAAIDLVRIEVAIAPHASGVREERLTFLSRRFENQRCIPPENPESVG